MIEIESIRSFNKVFALSYPKMASSNRGDLNIGNRKHHHLPYLLSPLHIGHPPIWDGRPCGKYSTNYQIGYREKAELGGYPPPLKDSQQNLYVRKTVSVERRLVCDKFGARHPNDRVLTLPTRNLHVWLQFVLIFSISQRCESFQNCAPRPWNNWNILRQFQIDYCMSQPLPRNPGSASVALS